MKIIIFAGGTGTRLWPLSRQNSPKQFGRIFEGKSTLQLTVERIEKGFKTEDIYISTNERYLSTVKRQIPQIPAINIVAEPEKRDVAPAIGYNFMRLQKAGYRGPIAIIWADHLIENVKEFVSALKKGEKLVKDNPHKLVFIGEEPRFPNENLGWIHIGKKIKKNIHQFVEWHYRPPLKQCKKMFASGKWLWNPGYFIVNLNFTINLYKKYMPKMYDQLKEIMSTIGTIDEVGTLKKVYPKLESISFDNAIVEKVPSDQAIVLKVNMNWSDPGTLYAFKEALCKKEKDNFTQGLNYSLDNKDCLIINEEDTKLVTAIGLEGTVIVNTKDALVVVHKDNVPKVKELVNKLRKKRKLKQYT